MFREKYNSFTQKRGYLYIRETHYIRDKRTLRKTPSKLCDGTSTKQRGKYSVKKDIYCGKIFEKEIKHIITFKDYLKEQKIEFETIKKSSFDKILDTFIQYLLYSYEILPEEIFQGKKRVFAINNGYLSRETILWFRKFTIRNNYSTQKELERFTNRAEDMGIFDTEIISTLFSKILPKNSLLEEDAKDKQTKLKKIKIKKFKEFLHTSIQ